MNEKRQSTVASIIILLVGVWLVLSPIWVVLSTGAAVSTIIVGAIMALAGLVQLFWEQSIPSWISGLAAVWLFISAFAFDIGTGGMWSLIVSSVAVFILSYWDGFEVSRLHRAHAHT